MALPGEIQTVQGRYFQMGGNGEWREISKQEADLAQSNPAARFVVGALGGGAQGLGMAGALGAMTPALDIAGGLYGAGKGAVRALGRRRMASQVARQIKQMNPPRSETIGNPRLLAAAEDMNNPAFALERQQAMRSVGASETRAQAQSLWDEFTSPADLTVAQIKAIPEAERLGFKFVPGQIRGTKLLYEGVMSNPILRTAYEAEFSANRGLINRNALRTVRGLSGVVDDVTNFDADTLAAMSDVIGRRFDNVRDSLDGLVIPKALADDMADYLTPRQIRRTTGFGGEPATTAAAQVQLRGRKALELRSQLNSIRSDLYRKGDWTQALEVADILDEMDELISARLGSGASLAWRSARQESRFLRVFEKPGVLNLDKGQINLRSLNTALRRDFKVQYGRQAYGARKGLTPAQSDFLDTVRVANAFADNVGDSGTATRTLGSMLMLNPKEAGKAYIARAMLQSLASIPR